MKHKKGNPDEEEAEEDEEGEGDEEKKEEANYGRGKDRGGVSRRQRVADQSTPRGAITIIGRGTA